MKTPHTLEQVAARSTQRFNLRYFSPQQRYRYRARLKSFDIDPSDVGADHLIFYYTHMAAHYRAKVQRAEAIQQFHQWESNAHETKTKRQSRKAVAPYKATRA